MKYLSIKKDILATLSYFNLFDYPLLKNEIFTFLSHCDNFREFEEALDDLTNKSVVYKTGELYSLQNNSWIAERRRMGNDKAVLMLKTAGRVAKLISYFPFVKGVAVSGSLSKYFVDEKSDIDFFIITTTNRLWIARTFLHIFKKLTFLFNKQALFCMNYFIDESEPMILEKNIYTAIEVTTVLPMYDDEIFEKFFKSNSWTKTFFPNTNVSAINIKKISKSWLKLLVEKMLNNHYGENLDNFLMNLTAKSWDAKTRSKKMNSKSQVLSMHVGKHFSKPNPDLFQKKILLRYENSLEETFRQFESSGHNRTKEPATYNLPYIETSPGTSFLTK